MPHRMKGRDGSIAKATPNRTCITRTAMVPLGWSGPTLHSSDPARRYPLHLGAVGEGGSSSNIYCGLLARSKPKPSYFVLIRQEMGAFTVELETGRSRWQTFAPPRCHTLHTSPCFLPPPTEASHSCRRGRR